MKQQKDEKDKSVEVKQSNTLVSARYDMSAAELNIFIMLLYEMKKRDYKGNYFRISLAKLQEYSDTELNYSYVKAAAEKLLTRVARIVEGGRHQSFNFISSVDFMARNLLDTVDGNLFIELGVDSKILPYYQELEMFTTFQLNTALNIKGKYGKRFYMLLSRFKSTGYYVVNIEELKETLGISKETYSTWDNFKQRVLEPAEKELREANDVWFTWKINKKKGKKIVSLFFEIQQQHTVTGALPVRNDKLFQRMVTDYKLAEWQANEILNKLHESEIQPLLFEIQVTDKNEPRKNLGAYTARLFSDRFGLKVWNGKSEQQPELPLK